MIFTITVFYSGCASKEEFYKGTYNFIQDNNFCSNSQGCKDKKLHSNNYNQNEEKSYDYYKDGTKQ